MLPTLRLAVLATLGVVGGTGAIIALSSPAKAGSLTLYGRVDRNTPPGKYPVTLEFRDIETKRLVQSVHTVAIVEDGRYYAKAAPGELKAFRPYQLEVASPSPAVPPMVDFVELQAASPGTAQTGHLNITGFVLAGRIGVGTSPSLARVQVNEPGPIQGVRAITASGTSVYGQNNAATGFSSGGYFTTASPDGRAMVADALSLTGATNGGRFYARSPDGAAVWGKATATSGAPVGVYGETLSATGTGVVGSGPGTGGKFVSSTGTAVQGDGVMFGGKFFASNLNNGVGVSGLSNANAGRFVSTGTGLNAIGLSAEGRTGGEFMGTSQNGIGLNATGVKYGGVFTASSSMSTGLKVDNTNTLNGIGIEVISSSSSSARPGVFVTNRNFTNPTNIVSVARGSLGRAVIANSNASNNGYVYHSNATLSAWNLASSGTAVGVYAVTASNDGYGVYAQGGGGSANVAIRCIGKLTATGTKSFVIDDPRDPLNAELHHFCSEGPEPYNVYRGNVTLNAAGQAVVTLPGYFEQINRDATYGLTPIGAPADLYVLAPIQNSRFTIAGGKPGMAVSWTVTGVRNDPYVRAHPMPVEVRKPLGEQGTYLAPEAYGKPDSAGVGSRTKLRVDDVEQRPSKP